MAHNKLHTAVSGQDHIQGNEKASITLLEYGDYQCPFCGMAYPVVKRLQRHFGKDLRFSFRNFPLIQSHQHALLAAAAAEAAGNQGRFWEMHDMLYENQDRLTAQDLAHYATSLQLDLRKFDEDIKSEAILNRVRADYMSGEMSGVEGTPTFFINDVKYVGPSQFDEMKRFIEGIIDQPSLIV
ncbi:MAG: DsbA family protein [Bdellovibrionales bacterium]|nr:DsbA family protein [Bdellovibrionales bacterium]